jgi:Family of unknown function (DUF6186)
MTRVVTIAGFVAVFVAGVVVQLVARRPGSRIAAVGDVLGQVMRQRTGRVIVFLMWFWFGWHFIAR